MSLLKIHFRTHIVLTMEKLNRTQLLLTFTTILYVLGQILFVHHIEKSFLYYLYLSISIVLSGGNIFFLIHLQKTSSSGFLKVLNSYLFFSTFIFYLSYCLKIVLLRTESGKGPFILETLILVTIIFNGIEIFITSREIKRKQKEFGKAQKGLTEEIFSWVDAIVSAVIFVLLIHTFLVQLYKIPSESMFPIFFNGDRPVVSKISRGPIIPFTNFRIPPLREIKRGDIVTFRNPRYEKTPASELKQIISQFLYMITLSTVNIDKYDDEGNIKADPLVKRVVALPGEQLQIINDRIYIRDNLNKDFTLQKKDINSATDLYDLDEKTLSKLEYIPLREKQRNILNLTDIKLENLNRKQVTAYIESNIKETRLIRSKIISIDVFTIKNSMDDENKKINQTEISINHGYLPFQKMEFFRNDGIHIFYNLDNDELWEKTWHFLSSVNTTDKLNDFQRISSNTDLQYKLLVSQWLLFNLENMISLLSESNTSSEGIEKKMAQNGIELEQFIMYILRFYDSRNLPPFPQNALLRRDNYFLMGDNRYNSKDLRHGLHRKNRYFISGDTMSFVYNSLLSPISIHESDIEGFVLFRAFPFDRIGTLK